jgi:hypothetical protein
VSGNYIVLVDTRTKAQSILSTPGPATILGFSPDGAQLLISVGSGAEGEHEGDLYTLDLRHGGRRFIAKNVYEAIWIGAAQQTLASSVERGAGNDATVAGSSVHRAQFSHGGSIASPAPPGRRRG